MPGSSTSQRPSQREAATEIVRRLVDAGYEAYFAGGCVRDELLGHEPDDFDVATNARPDSVLGVFPGAHGVGESFGVMLVRLRGHVIQAATFRAESDYTDHRHPDHVTFTDARHDAQRRDFTINGLFEDPLTGTVVDHVQGRADRGRKTSVYIYIYREREREMDTTYIYIYILL